MRNREELDSFPDAVRRLELMAGQLGTALQASTQQSFAFGKLLGNLERFFSDLLVAVLGNRELLLGIKDEIAQAAAGGAERQDSDAFEDDTPLVLVRPLGNLGNRMIQHMVALSIASRVPGARIPRVELPEWHLVRRCDDEALGKPQLSVASMMVDVHQVGARMRRGDVRTVGIEGYAQHIDNFMPADAYRRIFVTHHEVTGFGPDRLLISLRMGDIAEGRHPAYVLLPVSFYQEVVAQTGLRPVFFGQLTESAYLAQLRRAFPKGEFIEGRSAIHDFETIRRSRNIVLSVSTFSWLAGWLSDADQVIMPLAGLFNPVFGKVYGAGHNLIPRNDPRFRYYLFPLSVAAKPDELASYHDSIRGLWRQVDSLEMEALLDRHDHLERNFDLHARLFDEDWYRLRYPELNAAIAEGHIESGRHHYELHGFRERRAGFELDMEYANRYPDAGVALSEGRFYDLAHFHAERGSALGYKPVQKLPVAAARQRKAATSKPAPVKRRPKVKPARPRPAKR